MAVYLGRDGSVGLGQESTYGTAVTRTNWRPYASCSLLRKIVRNPRPDLKSSASNSAMRRTHYDANETVEGETVVMMTFDNFGMWLKNWLGGTPTTTGVGPYTHTFKLSATLPFLTVEHQRGTPVSGAVQVEVFNGCKIAKGALKVDAGGVMMGTFGWLGRTASARAGAGSTPSYATNENPILHSQAGQLSFNAATYDLVSLDLSLDNALEPRFFLGSELGQEPQRADFATVELSVVVEGQDALYTALHADTTGDVAITFSGPSSRSFAITLSNGWLIKVEDPVTSAGRVMQSVTWRGESNGTNEGLQFVVVNDNATATAN